MFGGGALGFVVLLLAVLAMLGALRVWVAYCDHRLRRRPRMQLSRLAEE